MCGCRKGRAAVIYALPENGVWGPIVWTILHRAAESTGSRSDSRKLWVKAISALSNIIPCTECRAHLAEYIAANPFNPPEVGARIYAREWLWRFHNAVNTRLGKGVFVEANLTSTYAGLDVKIFVNQYTAFLPELLKAGIVNRTRWSAFITPILAIIS